ncbi:elongation factor 1-beta [Candidatus Woesearchaeota archaeon CG_4_10_14_0_2_um_filter_57_5]|nr:MAG: hypothetical protein AUJ68_01835 [Candidatus Woesearchaeota archaeon CG1_02_57_44]PIZ48926.1 MAG: elongation factor 1-beta [Candidatus Woesearchaeota archaeon CG_4_10_14_0_2_um_filter_57_5]
MANVVITLKIMPSDIPGDLEGISAKAQELITAFGGDGTQEKIEPVAFGVKSLSLTFVADEAGGGTDELESKIRELDGVASCETTDVRRTIG